MINQFPLKVVVVDDDRMTLKCTEIFLKNIDEIQVKSFSNPIEALDWIKSNSANILITDLSMKEMNGDVLIREVNALRQGIVTVIIAGTQTVLDIHSCFRAGAWNYIIKPVSQSDIEMTIKELVAHFCRWNEIFKSATSSKKTAS